MGNPSIADYRAPPNFPIQCVSVNVVIDTWSVNITSHNNTDWLDIRYRLVSRDTLSGYTFRLDDIRYNV